MYKLLFKSNVAYMYLYTFNICILDSKIKYYVSNEYFSPTINNILLFK